MARTPGYTGITFDLPDAEAVLLKETLRCRDVTVSQFLRGKVREYLCTQKPTARKNNIVEGLEAAVAYAKGDKTKGTLMRFRVRKGTAMRIVK